MPKGRKRKADGAADVPEEELQRRKRQKELQAVAIKLRAGGKAYVPARKRGHKHAAEGQAGPKQAGVHKKQRTGGPKADVPQMVVLPIYWNSRERERDQVLEAANRALKVLQEGGVNAKIDATDRYTPGQKMKHWETLGVKVRVEIGPKEALAGNCLLAVANAPGQVANKSSVKVEKALKQRALAALAAAGVQVQPPEGGADAAGSGGMAAGDTGVGASEAAGVATGQQAGEGGAGLQQAQGHKHKRKSVKGQEQSGAVHGDGAGGAQAQGKQSQGAEPQQEQQQARQERHRLAKQEKKKKKQHKEADGVSLSAGSGDAAAVGALGAAGAAALHGTAKGSTTMAKQQEEQLLVSGDAMDDFVIEVVQEGIKTQKAKGKKQKQGAKLVEGGGVSGSTHVAAPKVKQAKLVVF